MSTDECKVVSLKGEPIRSPGEPQPDLIARLERMLEMARAGEISGGAFVYEFRDEGYSCGYAGSFNRPRIIGGLEELKFILVRKLVDG